MGDIADWTNDTYQDANPSWFPVGDPYRCRRQEPSQNIECKHCGKAGLHWEDDNGQWRLFNAKGAAHVCEPTACEFDDLTKED